MGYSIYTQNYAFKAHILDAYAGYMKERPNLEKKSRRTDYFIYKKKKKKNYNTSCLLCSEFWYTYSIYTQNYAFKAHILDAYPGYKKLRPNLEKKSRQTDYFIYKKKYIYILQYFMPIVFRISVHIFHIHS